MTNSSGTIVAEYTYDAYGNLISMSGSQEADNPVRFSTKYFDGDTGYYDFGFRSYDPVTGRWLNRDPIGEDGGLNLYGFAGNNPGNMWDEYRLAGKEHDIIPQVLWRTVPKEIRDIFDSTVNRIYHPDYIKINGPTHDGNRYSGYSARNYKDAVERELKVFLKNKKILRGYYGLCRLGSCLVKVIRVM